MGKTSAGSWNAGAVPVLPGQAHCGSDSASFERSKGARSGNALPCTLIGTQPPEANLKKQGEEEEVSIDVMQFSTSIFYAMEDEETLELDVARFGKGEGVAEARWRTEDASGKAGRSYVAAAGRICFGPGEFTKTIEVNIIDNPFAETLSEFFVVLFDAVGGSLGRYLHRCRVLIIDKSYFPTNKYGKQLEAWMDKGVAQDGEKVTGISRWGMMVEYFKMNVFNNHTIKRGSIQKVIFDFFDNLYFISNVFVVSELTDQVIASQDGSVSGNGEGMERSRKICLILAVAYVAPMAIKHFLDYQELRFRIGGTSRKTLQTQMLRRYLNYDERARASISVSDMQVAIVRDTEDLVRDGFMKIFPITQSLGRIFITMIFQCFRDPASLVGIAALPILLLAFLVCRTRVTESVREKHNICSVGMAEHIDVTVDNYSLVAAYMRRPMMVDKFEDVIGKYNAASVCKDTVHLNNVTFASWLSVLLAGVYMFLAPDLVGAQGVTVGCFLATIALIRSLGQEFQGLYRDILDIQSAISPLMRLVMYMNLPTDLMMRRSLNRVRRRESLQERRLAHESIGSGHGQGSIGDGTNYAVDLIPIALRNVSFRYKSEEVLFQNVDWIIQQGELTAIVGPRGEGKATLLKLLGLSIFAEDGTVFIPGHLRVLFIQQEPCLISSMSLLDNMTFGSNCREDEIRAQRILGRLEPGMSLVDKLASKHVENWRATLSATERAIISLARALVYNPEVLVLAQPLTSFDDFYCGRVVLNLLRAFVDDRGLEMDATQRRLRRLRTCIFTSNSLRGLDKIVDNLAVMNKRDGLQILNDEQRAHANEHPEDVMGQTHNFLVGGEQNLLT